MVQAAAGPLFEIEPDNCTNEEAIMYLLKLEEPGCPLPSNVTKDVDPHSNSPENLPGGIWYLLAKSKEKVKIQNGFWKLSRPPSKVFCEPPLSGWRTTLDFFGGPDLQKTIWMMHEFNITRDGSTPDVNIKNSSVLCRVFQRGKLHKMPSKVDGNDFSPGRSIYSSPKLCVDTENRIEQGSTSAHQDIDNSAVHVVGPEIHPTNRAEDFFDIDYISTGDFLELRDLSFPVSPSSSSENSSCVTISSDECFDSLALLQDIEQGNNTHCHLSISASTRAENTVLDTTDLSGVLVNNGEEIHETADGNGKYPNDAPSGVLVNNGEEILETADGNRKYPSDAPSGVLMNSGEEIHESADGNGKYPNDASADENCSTAMDGASSSGHSSDPEGSKKGGGGKRMKKMKGLKKKYLCFMPFFM